MANGITDEAAGGQYYFDRGNNLFWTWDTPALTGRKLSEIVVSRGLGGMMGWGLGQDSYDFSHILALRDGLTRLSSIS